MHLSPVFPEPALAELRRAQRSKRLENLDWVDALYHAYLAAIVALVIVVWSSSLLPDREVTAAGVSRALELGPVMIGAVVAFAFSLGARAGSQGGPLALEQADVAYVLLAPVDRGAALLPSVLRHLRTTLFASGVVGAVIGQLALRRLPGDPAAWVGCGALAGFLAGAAYSGAALTASGHRWSRKTALLIGLVALAPTAVDLVAGGAISPWTILGRVGTWPLRWDPLALLLIGILLVLPVLGIYASGGTSLEAARRRAGLQAQLRFAATLYDVRTIIILRRLLSQEGSRVRPWVRLRVSSGRRFPVWRRDRHAFLRWPAVRLLRLCGLGVIAAFACVGAWRGIEPLIIVAGGALYLAGLDAVEPLAQEVDHPQLSLSLPVKRGVLYLQHLLVPGIVMFVACALGMLAILPFLRSTEVLEIGMRLLPGAALAAVCGAALSVVGEAAGNVAMKNAPTPELMGITMVVMVAWPPAVALVGVLPVVFAANQTDPVSAVANAVPLTFFLCFAVLMWLYFREGVLASVNAARGDV